MKSGRPPRVERHLRDSCDRSTKGRHAHRLAARRGAAADSVRKDPAAEWFDGDLFRGPSRAGGGGRPLVPRRRGERAQGPQRIRAPLRAPHVPGIEAPARRRAHRLRHAGAQRRHQPERHHHLGSHQLFRDHARRPARARALAGERSDGLSPRHRRSEEARYPARGGAQREAAEYRERAVRPRRGAPLRAALPAAESVLRLRDRLARGSDGGLRRGREGLLPHLLRAEQRFALDRRRFRDRESEAAGGEVLRSDRARAGQAARHGKDRAAGEGSARDAARSGAAGEGLDRVRRSETAGEPRGDDADARARGRQVESALSRPRLREEDRAGRGRVVGPGHAARRSDRDHRHRAGGSYAGGSRGRPHR